MLVKFTSGVDRAEWVNKMKKESMRCADTIDMVKLAEKTGESILLCEGRDEEDDDMDNVEVEEKEYDYSMSDMTTSKIASPSLSASTSKSNRTVKTFSELNGGAIDKEPRQAHGPGHVLSWGNNAQGQLGRSSKLDSAGIPTEIKALKGSRIVCASAACAAVTAISEDGSLYVWGAASTAQFKSKSPTKIEPSDPNIKFTQVI